MPDWVSPKSHAYDATDPPTSGSDEPDASKLHDRLVQLPVKAATGGWFGAVGENECVIEFVHDPAKAELTLTLVKKPWLLPEGMLWSGFSETLERCRKEA